jgi:maltose-binding protein MalE
MVSPKGFSINANITNEKKKWVINLIEYLMSEENQMEATKTLYTMPTNKNVINSKFVQSNEILRNSQIQIEHGNPMPVVPELRAIWDAMRPSYQAVLAGSKSPEQAVTDMQMQAVQRIKEMNE